MENHSNEGGTSPLHVLGGSRKPARQRAFIICLYCIMAVDTMHTQCGYSHSSIPCLPRRDGLYTLTCEPNRMSFSPEVASFPKPHHSNKKSNQCRLQPEPQRPFEALSIKKPFLLPLCHFLCGENVSFLLYNSLALFLYAPFFPLDWGFSFFLCFLSVCPCSQARIRVSSGFNCSLKPSTSTPNLHHFPSRDFKDTEEQEISIRQNFF